MTAIRQRYYLGDAFVVEHRPASGPIRATGILVLPPLGYEDTSAYRPLRVLADALAEAGHLVLRLDWPGLGDSAGDAWTPGLLDRQREAAGRAIESLRQRGISRVAVIGVRAGGLLGLACPGIDEVVLWGVPKSGRAFLREERAFHRMAARAFSAPPADRPPSPEGTVEAGGFLYSPETVTALEGLVAAELLSRHRLERALLIPREGTSPPAGLVAALEQEGTAVQVSSAGGLGDLLEDPYRAALSSKVRAEILVFFEREEPRVGLRPAKGASRLLLEDGIREQPWLLAGGRGELSGILCEPAGGACKGAAWTVFYNAGGVRRSGPNRLWTLAARRLAAAGRPSLRLDVRDVGDSDGTAIPHRDLEEMYSDASIQDAVDAVDDLRHRGAGPIDAVGLCSGAFLSLQVAARRPIRRVVLFNGLVFIWDDDARTNGMTSQIRRSLLDGRRWKRLLTGRIDARALASAILDQGRLRAEALLARARGEPPPDEVARLLDLVESRGTVLQLVSSEGDPSIAYVERHVPPDRRPRIEQIPGVDHTIRPVWAHERVLSLVVEGPQPGASQVIV